MWSWKCALSSTVPHWMKAPAVTLTKKHYIKSFSELSAINAQNTHRKVQKGLHLALSHSKLTSDIAASSWNLHATELQFEPQQEIWGLAKTGGCSSAIECVLCMYKIQSPAFAQPCTVHFWEAVGGHWAQLMIIRIRLNKSSKLNDITCCLSMP